MSKKKKNTNNKYKGKNKSQKNIPPDPKKFFKSIGLKPFHPTENEMSHVLRRDFGQETEKQFWVAENHTDHRQSWFFSHSNIGLAKIRYRNDFDILCNIASQLAEIKVPSSPRVLDVGGAAGPLAFWMQRVWNAKEVVVADMYPTMGQNWANQLGITGVRYVNATLPDMVLNTNKKFDVIVLSRVLHFIRGVTYAVRF
jgi:2-polyprenyl-3-methyl-5-hydroxy-6-metoxy-1,4-benzoquinol methylase